MPEVTGQESGRGGMDTWPAGKSDIPCVFYLWAALRFENETPQPVSDPCCGVTASLSSARVLVPEFQFLAAVNAST